ncbi:N-acetylneuraminate synthase [Saprospiraceae bacterium]|nr:N-acetylneuraminate synthase [Saprospiraceae bacterium]
MSRTLIIAEAGVNHNGSIEIAKQLIDCAAEAGVDYVKFQTFKADKLVSRSAKKASYQVENTGSDDSQYEMIKKLELDEEKHNILIEYCNQKGIKFLSTAFDHDSIDLLEELGIDLFKVPSGEITNKPFLQKIASKNKPIILSTGMSNIGEIEDALDVLYESGTDRNSITILHCNTEYPTPMDDVNLSAMNTIGEAFKVDIGYSDHTLGIEIPIAAVAIGAVCIEKHFTLDRSMEGPDHRASLEPPELKEMVRSIRNIELALGNGIKKASASEMKNIIVARKSIHTSRILKKGHVITKSDLIMKRPGNGVSPMDIDLIIGHTIKEDIKEDSMIKYQDLL